MSSVESTAAHVEFAEQAERLSALAETIMAEGAEQVSEEAVQKLMAAAVRLYAAKRATDADFPPFTEEHVTATEVAVTTTAMLKAVRLELFELTLWNGWGRA